LHQQLAAYKRMVTRPKLRATDRRFSVGLAMVWPGEAAPRRRHPRCRPAVAAAPFLRVLDPLGVVISIPEVGGLYHRDVWQTA
jgi:hypothetical protein